MKSRFMKFICIAAIVAIVFGVRPASLSALDEITTDETSSFNQKSTEDSEIPGPQSRHGGKDLMEEFDTDQDDLLSREEFPGPADHFDMLDTDEDGYLDTDELRNGRPGPPKGGRFTKDDTNQDGKVSREEFSGPEDFFDHIDKNGDGYITKEEARQGHPVPHGNTPETTE